MSDLSGATWEKPELIVLVRSRPEEAVLTGCKSASVSGVGKNGRCQINGNDACATQYES